MDNPLLMRKVTLITLLVVISFSFVYSADLRALPHLKPSLIDSKYDIPVSIPIATNTSTLPPYPRAYLQHESSSSGLGPWTASINQPRAGDIWSLSTCEKLPVKSVNAIGSDGNVPSNGIDNNPDTRWSNLGQGSWIQLDLGSKANICSVDIAWYHGDARQNNFVISVSDDGY